MYEYLGNNLKPYKKPINNGTIQSEAPQQKKKFSQNFYVYLYDDKVVSQLRTGKIRQKLKASLPKAGLQAWIETQILLFKEVKRYCIVFELSDSRIYEKTLCGFI